MPDETSPQPAPAVVHERQGSLAALLKTLAKDRDAAAAEYKLMDAQQKHRLKKWYEGYDAGITFAMTAVELRQREQENNQAE